jgi:Tfp pilus assembly protein PilF
MNKEAIEVYKQAISLKADDADVYNNLGAALDYDWTESSGTAFRGKGRVRF